MSRDQKGKFGIAENSVRRAAAYARPLAVRSSTAAKHGIHAARARLAPRIERTGRVLEDTVAPRVSGYLSTAAQHVAPDVPRRSRLSAATRLAGVAAAAAGAVTAVVRQRRKPRGTDSANDTAQTEAASTDETA